MKLFFLCCVLLLLCMFESSCTSFTNRRYTKGLFFYSKKDLLSNHNDSVLKYKTNVDTNFIPSNSLNLKIDYLYIKRNVKDTCDTIVLNSNQRIHGFITKITSKDVYFNMCDTSIIGDFTAEKNAIKQVVFGKKRIDSLHVSEPFNQSINSSQFSPTEKTYKNDEVNKAVDDIFEAKTLILLSLLLLFFPPLLVKAFKLLKNSLNQFKDNKEYSEEKRLAKIYIGLCIYFLLCFVGLILYTILYLGFGPFNG